MYETPYMLSARDSDILEAVYQYHYLTVEQVTRLFFSKNSSHYTNEQLKRLVYGKTNVVSRYHSQNQSSH